MKKFTSMLVLTVAALLLTACGDHYRVKEGSSAPVRIRDDNLPGTQIRWNNVSLLDKSIANKVLVESTNSRRTATNTLQVWALFPQPDRFPPAARGPHHFFDASQMPFEGPTAWQRIMLPPNANGHYKEFSTRVDIGYYTIEVREGR